MLRTNQGSGKRRRHCYGIITLTTGIESHLTFENQAVVDEFFRRMHPLGIRDLQTWPEASFLNATGPLLDSEIAAAT